MIPRFRAWNKATKEMYEADDIIAINFEDKSICVQTIYFEQGLPVELFKQFRVEVEELRANYKNSLAKYIMDVKGCDRKEANRIKDSINRCYVECIVLTPLKVIQMEGMLSRELFSEIADFVFNNYDWPDRLDDDADRIVLKYRTKGELGRKKPSVKRALYTALAMGL
ncbi:DUF1340 domain-containing protein [Streptococcus salivarius]|uniref:DUF1340 domain-containing protein n=1 Tax=Streptococcus salivarius TaxID=1304 RepID=UPI001155F1FE|nr:DUF1340 domain-containing protein [Streptococcus salivarius]